MYDHTQFVKIGDAHAVILGISMLGCDPDGSDFPVHFEFQMDTEDADIAK
jgi:hypothetical protein